MDTDGLNLGEKKWLSGKLLEEHDLIKRHFRHLVSETLKSLEERGIGPKALIRHLTGLQALDPVQKDTPLVLFQDRLEKMQKCTSVQEVLTVVQDGYSFFNYGLIEDIIMELGSTDDEKMLQKYKEHLKVYCERSIFEIPHSYGPPGDCLVFMNGNDEFEKYTVNEVDRFIFKLTEIFNITRHTLRLVSIKKGSIQLTFHIPDFVAKVIFPLSRDQERALEGEGITEITCRNYHVSLKVRISTRIYKYIIHACSVE